MKVKSWLPRPTRYPELGYVMLEPRCWRIVDIEQSKYNNYGNGPEAYVPSVIGPVYKTKAELLADLGRYAKDYGCA